MKPKRSGISRVLHGFHHAFAGLAWALKTQINLRIHLAATLAAITLGLIQNLLLWKWCVLILCIAVVWTAELLNTAIEVVCDRLSREHDELIRCAKDVAAAAVFCASLGAAILGFLIFT